MPTNRGPWSGLIAGRSGGGNRGGFQPPWNLKVGQGLRDKLVPRWVEDFDLDLEHHFRHTALPKPGGERQLGKLLEDLHSRALDPRRPLWELHLIEGLAPNRFALYLKIHHSVIDGTSVMRLLMEMLSGSPNVADVKAIWTIGATRAPKDKKGTLPSVGGLVRATTGLVGAFSRPLRDSALVAPYSAPRSLLSAPMNGQRRFATAQLPLADVKAAATASEAPRTISCCGCAAPLYSATWTRSTPYPPGR